VNRSATAYVDTGVGRHRMWQLLSVLVNIFGDILLERVFGAARER
jgi:hypothetical protein